MNRLRPSTPARRPFRAMRAGAVALLGAALILTGVDAAHAAERPRLGQVGVITFVGASINASGSKASLKIDWADIPHAKAYDVYAATSWNAVLAMDPNKPTVRGVKSSKATIPNLKPGTDYYVQVRATTTAKGWLNGYRSQRVARHTMVAERASTAANVSALTWNVCSYSCKDFGKRKKIIDARIAELKPDIVTLQEARNYTKATKGYSFAVDWQDDILIRKGSFTRVASSKGKPTNGHMTFGRNNKQKGHGMAWAAVRHSSGQYLVVFSVHLSPGTSKAAVDQRVWETGKAAAYVTSTLKTLQKNYPALTNWTKAPTILGGDMNTHKSRENDGTGAALQKKGWYDAYYQAHKLSGQRYYSANPAWSAKPETGRWGSHIDQFLVKPGRTVVTSWVQAGKRKGSRFVTPLGSDHHPVMVTLSVR